MHPAVASRLVARSRRADTGPGTTELVDNTHHRTDAVPVRPRAAERHRQPVIGVAAVVAQDRRLGVEVGDDDVDVPVVIEIGEGGDQPGTAGGGT